MSTDAENNDLNKSHNSSAFASEGIFREGEEFMVGPTDNTDYVELEKKRRIRKNIGLSVGALALLGLGSVFAFLSLDNDEDTTPTPTQNQTSTQQGVKTTADINPILAQYPKAPEVSPSETLINVKKGAIISSDKNTLSIPQHKITASAQPCKVTQSTDFCLVAKGQGDGTGYDIYYLKDAAHSRLFENAKDFRKATVANSPSAGVLSLDIGDKKATTGVIVNKNSSGWMLVKTSGEDKINNIITKAKITS